MDLYTVLLFVHVLAAALWVGGGVMLHLIAERAVKSEDATRIGTFLADAEHTGKTFFGPASGVTLLAGIWLVFEGDWGWDHVFILGGILGILVSMGIGFGGIQPASMKVGQALATGGTVTDEVRAGLKRIQTLARIDTLILIVVVFLMTNKPGS